LARIDDLPLFSTETRSRTAPEPHISAVEEALRTVDPDSLSPKSALELLYALKRKLAEGES
jgi:DNA mismatch repair protein MutS